MFPGDKYGGWAQPKRQSNRHTRDTKFGASQDVTVYLERAAPHVCLHYIVVNKNAC